MPNCNTIYNTPVRHDELSITKTSFRSRVLVSNINHRTTREKARKNRFGDRKEKKKMNMSIPLEKNNYSSYETKSDESVIENEISLIKVEEGPISQKTQHPNVDQLGITRDFHINQESIVQEQKYSSPKITVFPVKAVSSTPNQELFNHSKLARSASTQTTFTLGPSNCRELIDNLKSYCVEIPHTKVDDNVDPNFKPMFDADTSCSSPLRDLWTRKLISFENTPVKNNTPSVRKLSLRSKTMICSAMERTNNRSNTFIKYKSAEEKRLFSNTFSTMPHPKTPPSSTSNVFHNPFEKDLTERLSKSIFSPDVFDVVVSPSENSEDLRWTIEDISSINPVPIDEDFTVQSDDEDPEKESQVQQEIDRYFSETHVVLSPFENPVASEVSKIKRMFPVTTAASTPQKINLNVAVELKNANTQTTLTLPESLPQELEKSLISYFKFFDTDDLNLSASNLRRKLFFHSGDEAPSPVRFDSCSSPIMKNPWSDLHSPLIVTKNERHFTPRAAQQELSSPEVSPVPCTSMKSKPNSISFCKKKLHHHFHGDQEHSEEGKDIMNVGPVVNSTVIMTSSEGQSGMTLDYSVASSALPSSQDTGYDTEESWQHSPNKLTNFPFSVMASTPTHKIK